MQGCVVSFKECWQDGDGHWFSHGGFPLQMKAISSLFDRLTILTVRGEPRAGGIVLPANASVVSLERPAGEDLRRKISVITHLLYYVREITRQVRQCDVVYIPLPGDIPLLGMIAALVLRKRMLARYGGSWIPTSETTLMNRVTRFCMRAFAGGRNLMLATGAGSRPPAPGIKWMYVTSISRKELDTVRPNLGRPASSDLRLVYAGRLSPEKGVVFLIEAMRILKERGQTAAGVPRLTIAGDGPQRSYLEGLVEKYDCASLISFKGQLGRQQLLNELLIADICVLPSLTESFCKARLDAMLCGAPVVTTEVGFGRELIGEPGERGWIVPAGDAASIANLLDQIRTDSIDWPATRSRCRSFVGAMSLEAWTADLGAMCARQWGLRLEEGKLR